AHAPVPMLTGFNGTTTSYGAVLTRLKGQTGEMPPYVHLGSPLGVGGGRLGATYNPVEVRDPTGTRVPLPQVGLSGNVTADRFQNRRRLLNSLDRTRAQLHSTPAVERLDTYHQRAIDMLTSTRVRTAFDLSRESETLRNRYGANFFGQSCLLARRLVEAGTRFVPGKWYDGPAFDGWGGHGADPPGLARMGEALWPRPGPGPRARR